MSKFDRGVFIFIGLGIWALAMSQIFKPQLLQASFGITYSKKSSLSENPTIVNHKCPAFVGEHVEINERNNIIKSDKCNYLLVISVDDLY